MCAKALLQRILTKSCNFMHEKRLNTLVTVCNGLIHGEKLTMTELGNSLSETNGVSERHCIKRVSNFLSNPHIQNENIMIQAALAKKILSNFKYIRLIVDWTPAGDHKNLWGHIAFNRT